MATAVVPGSAASTSSKVVSDEERRWVVIGICLTKILTPALRKVLASEMAKWHQSLIKSPTDIDKQIYGGYAKKLPPSTIKLNYESINNNIAHKSPKLYDYAVRDPLSLAKLFMKPFMAGFTGFDHTMDTSAALSVICEAQPFLPSGAAGLAKKVRSDVRNEWAHCDFSHWTGPNFQTALNDIESLVKKVGLKPADEKIALDEVDTWRNNGLKICFGSSVVDCELLDLIRTEVRNLQESVKLSNEDSKADKERLLSSLQTFQFSLSEEIFEIKNRQVLTEETVGRLEREHNLLHDQYVSTAQDVEVMKKEIAKIAAADDAIPYVFQAPRKNPLFGGRSSELEELGNLLRQDEAGSKPKVSFAAVSGLGGVGKTSLATEYAQQKKGYYTGGVYWFSGENNTAFENSFYDVAARFGTQSDSFGQTFSATLTKISQNGNPWLIIMDNMDESDLSANIVKLVSGHWQNDASGHLLIITRRKPSALANDIRDFDERCCLSLKCFEIEEGKAFLLRRIGNVLDKEVDEQVADKLVQQLGGLPLALEQAGAYIKSLRCTISEYLEHYDKQRLRLLNRQKAAPVSEYDSPERLAVRTTWHLNFEHIKKNVDDGKAATRFLYATAFLDPNEIQKKIINVGERPVEDEDFNECVKTTFGRQQVLKLLTDFSLFRETPSSNLSVHHLVQEVIRDNLNPEEKIQSITDAIRMLHFALKKCSSPDELLSSVTDGRQHRPSIVSRSDLSHFHQWHKLCSHSYELVRHLKSAVKKSDVDMTKIFQPESARIVYECAIHLSVNSKHDEAKEVANFAKDILNLSSVPGSASSLFPHIIPLPELVCRHIQYSCNMPESNEEGGATANVDITSKQLEEMRMKGNDLYKKCCYNDALKTYSDAIDMSINTPLFDATLLSNRASVHLNLEKYKEALQDAEEYISRRPKCWKGYARKALALAELSDVHGARVAASLAYYHERNVFRKFPPFMKKFGSSLEMRLFVCRDISDLSAALRKVVTANPLVGIMNMLLSNTPDIDLPVIILEPGDYLISLNTVGNDVFDLPQVDKMSLLKISSCIFVGSEGDCTITVNDYLRVNFLGVVVAYNVIFHCRYSDFHFRPGSVVKLSHCSFTSSNNIYTSFCCLGELKVDSCKFHTCNKGGLLVVGNAEVECSEFYGNGAGGLEVREGGRLVVRKSKMHANKQGLLIGPNAKKCVVEDCQLYDNQWGGIVVDNCASGVIIRRNRIYDNDEPAVAVMSKSNLSMFDNEIFRNSDWGIIVHSGSQAVVIKNEIHDNQCGGICLEDSTSSSRTSHIENNHIFCNSGPGICEEGRLLTSRRGNNIHDNKEKRDQSTAQSQVKLCYYCKKPENNLKKCTNCFTAQYCGKQCQKSDWKNHKEVCSRLLSEGSIVLNYVRTPIMTRHLSPNELERNPDDNIFPSGRRGPGLLPVGPKYCPRPNTTIRFIVKMQAGVAVLEGKEYDPSVVRLYDRSLEIDGILTGAEQIYQLVRQHGAMGQLYNYWRKLFMWAKGPKNGKLRVFINEFPPYQNW